MCRAVPCCGSLLLLLHLCADRFASDELELKPEPTLESFGIRPSKGAAAANQQQQQAQQEEEGAAAAAAGNGAAAGSDDEPGGWQGSSLYVV
jgi:hypothetical protein